MRALRILALLAAPLLAQENAGEAEQAAQIARRLASHDDEEKLAGLQAAATNQHSSLLSPLTRLLKDRNPAVRSGAIQALQLRKTSAAQKRAALALAARLPALSKREDDRTELLAVIQALHDLAQPATIKALLDIKSGTGRDIMEARAMAVANVPSKEAIERLIRYGYRDRRGSDRTRNIATKALAYATQERVRGGIEAWRRWWSENEKAFDVMAAAEKRAQKRAEQAEKERRRQEKRERRRRKAEGGDAGEGGSG